MNLIDEFIEEDIKETMRVKQFSWLKSIVRLHSNQTNPFITSDFQDLINDPKILSSPVGKLFCEIGCEMEIDFPEENFSTNYTKTTSNNNDNVINNVSNQQPKMITDVLSTTGNTLQNIARAFSRNSIAHLKDINNTFGFNSTSTFFTNLHVENSQPTAGHLKLFSFDLVKFETAFKVIEPIVCSAFLYNENERKIVSDYWNFVPQICENFFTENKIPIDSNGGRSASFQVDPKLISECGTFLFILLSHPIGPDNSSSMIKYFQSPSLATETSAVKKLEQCFPRLKEVFSTFAVTYIEFSTLRNAGGIDTPVPLPQPFLIEAPLPEDAIKDFLVDSMRKNLKQISISIELLRVIDQTTSNINFPLIIRPTSKFRAQPLLSPVHQIVVHVNSLKLSPTLKQKNIVVSVSLKIDNVIKKGSSPNNKTASNVHSLTSLECVHLKLNPNQCGEREFTRCFYHNRSPVFDDSFLFDLPYPVPLNAVIFFEIFNAHLKQKAAPNSSNTNNSNKNNKSYNNNDVFKKEKYQKLTLIGVAKLHLLESKKQHLILKDGQHHCHIKQQQKDGSTEKSGNKLTVSTYLRSNLSTNEPKLLAFEDTTNSEISKRISTLPKDIIVTHMMTICDTIFNLSMKSDTFSFQPFIVLRDNCISILESIKFERFMMLYVRYFLFKNREPQKMVVRDQPISLSEQKVQPMSKAVRRPSLSSIHCTNSLISIPKLNQMVIQNNENSQISHDDGMVRDSLIDLSFRKSISKCVVRNPEDEHLNNFLNKFFVCFSKFLQVHQRMSFNAAHNVNESGHKNGLAILHSLIDFFFAFIIKTLMVSKINILGEEFDTFLGLFCKNIAKDIENSKKHAKSLGLFANLLFDIGMPTMATKVTKTLVDTYINAYPFHWIIITYINFAFRPSLFLYSLKYIDTFRSTVINLLQRAIMTTPIGNHINSNNNANMNDQNNSNTKTKTNSNSNTNTNAKSYTNSDTDAYTNTNTNTNTNINTNTNTNINSNSNTNSNINTNTNPNKNTNINTNTNTNTNINTNINTNTNQEVSGNNCNDSTKLPCSTSNGSLNSIPSYNYRNENLWPIFSILLHLFGSYDKDMSTLVASNLISCLKGIRPNQLPSTSEIITHLAFFNFLLGNADGASLKKFASSGDSPTLFRLVHFMIGRVTIKEMTIVRQHQIHNKVSQEQPPNRCPPQQPLKVVTRQRSETLKVKRNNNDKSSKLPPRSPPHLLLNHQKAQQTLPSEPTKQRKSNESKVKYMVKEKPLNANKTKTMPPSVLEMINATHSAMFTFAKTYLNVANLPVAVGLLGFLYHMLNVDDLQSIFYQTLFDLISKIIENFSPAIFDVNSPCWVRVFDCIFKLSPKIEEVTLIVKPIVTFLTADLMANKNQIISMSILVRSISFMKKPQLMSMKICEIFEFFKNSNNDSHKHLAEIFFILKTQAETMSQNEKSSPEEKCDALLARFFALTESPDAQFKTLNKLYKMHCKYGNKEEMINVSILQTALIVEYLVSSKRIGINCNTNIFDMEHPALLFIHNCPLVSYVIAPNASLPKVPGFVDSDCFCELCIISLIHRILEISISSSIFDTAISTIDLFWPILEPCRLYGQIEELFGHIANLFEKEKVSPSHNSDAMSYRYYRVTFYGTVFNKDHRKSYIYREDRLTGLFNFKDSIEKLYGEILNHINLDVVPEKMFTLKIISDSGKVEESTLDLEKCGFIQVTFVKPLIEKKSRILIVNSHEKKHSKNNTTLGITPLHSQFYFESPFVKGTNEKQGSIDKQWLRRTILSTKYALPSVCKRSLIISETIVDFEPIRVVYRQLRERTTEINEAYEVEDANKIQQLLSGSLVVTVNEGPVKIAEVFFSEKTKDDLHNEIGDYVKNAAYFSRRQSKLKQEFKRFLIVLEKAVLFHSEWVTKNTEFVQLQVQMEAGLEQLKSFLDSFIK